MSRLVDALLLEHLDEAEYLVGALGQALDSPVHTLEDVAEGEEERLHAHVDALVLAGAPIVASLLLPALHEGPAPRATAAAMALALADTDEVQALLLSQLGDCPLPLSSAWAEGLARAEARLSDARLVAGLTAPGAELCATALALRGVDVGARVIASLDPSASLGPFVRLARAAAPDAGVAPRVWPLAEDHPDPEIAEAALELALLARDPGAWSLIARAARAPERFTPLALQVVATLGRPDEAHRAAALLEVPACRRDVVYALGFAGLPEVMELLLPLLDDAALNPLVGEAYAALTGLELARVRAAPAPEPAALPPLEEDALDADLRPDRDAELEPVDAQRIRQDWAQQRARLTAGQRYLRGRVLTREVLREAVLTEPTRRRAVWARALWLSNSGRVHVAVRAPTARQRAQLARG